MAEPAKTEPAEFAGLRADLLVGGKYRLVEQRGTGAMGAVWSARHVTLGHEVAIKFLHGSVMSSEDARERFEREARLAARLGESSRHITRVIDHGVMEGDGKPYLVMELLQGEGLSAYLKRERRIPLARAARIVQHLARALHVTHSAGVIHRDLKPANVFLCNAEAGDEIFVKLLDFGVAKVTMDAEEATGSGSIVGTPSYMSPEQVTGDGNLDARSDLWSVAAMVYRMVVGRPPFGKEPLAELALRIVSTDPVPPSQIFDDLPPELDMWMARGLAKKPEERFQTARELADFLAVIAGINSGGQTAPLSRLKPAGSETDDRVPTITAALDDAASTADPRERRRHLVPIVVVGVLLFGAIIAVAAGLGRRSEPSTTAVEPTSNAPSAAPTTAQSVATPITTTEPTPTVAAQPAELAVAPAPSPSASPPKTPHPQATTYKKKAPQDSSGWGNKNEL